MNKKFELGRTVITAAVDNATKSDRAFETFVKTSLGRYANADWGDICTEDQKNNDNALKNGKRIFAAYIYSKTKQKIWIITEWDRSVTTILFPGDY